MFAKKSWRIDFCDRMYAPGIQFYQDKLQGLGFSDYNRVLDAGCGYGQWTLALASLNKRAVGIDILADRIAHAHSRYRDGASFLVGSIEDIPFSDGFFDAVFCFSAIYFTDVSKTLAEFHRVLQAGGKLCLNSNGVGYYIYELLIKRRLETLKTFWDSAIFRLTGHRSQELKLISSIAEMRDELKKAGFVQVKVLKEGTQLFKPYYFGLEGVFEMVAEAR